MCYMCLILFLGNIGCMLTASFVIFDGLVFLQLCITVRQPPAPHEVLSERSIAELLIVGELTRPVFHSLSVIVRD